MRFLRLCMLLLIMLMVPPEANGQSGYEQIEAKSAALFERGDWKELAAFGKQSAQLGFSYFGLNYRTGVALYSLGDYEGAERFLELAVKNNGSSEDACYYLYNALKAAGRQMEAERLAERYSFPEAHPKLFETVYLEPGIKMPVGNQAGDIRYLGGGLVVAPGSGLRLWQSISYMQQQSGGSGFRQYDYFLSLPYYWKDHWYLQPSVHGAYTDYEVSLVSDRHVSYETAEGNKKVHTYGLQRLHYNQSGKAISLNLALSASRRYGNLVIEAEPSLHYLNDKFSYGFDYQTAGITDSFDNGSFVGSGNYTETGSGGNPDTANSQFIGQAGLSASYTFPFWKQRLTVRLAGFCLFGKQETNTDMNLYLLLRCHRKLWLHLSYLLKDDLPLALSYEGQYYNQGSPVRNKLGCSFQLLPLAKLSPMLTYQYERQRPYLQDDIYFHSVFFTLKYRL